MSEHGSLVNINGYDFFIPGWDFLKGNIMPVDKEAFNAGDSVECMFGSTIQTIMMLFVALRNEAKGSNVEWSLQLHNILSASMRHFSRIPTIG